MSIRFKGALIYFVVSTIWFALAEITIPENVGGMRVAGAIFLLIAAWQLVFGFSKKQYAQAQQQSEANQKELAEAGRLFRSGVLSRFYPLIAIFTILPWIGLFLAAPRPSGYSEWALAGSVIAFCALLTYFIVAFLWAFSQEQAVEDGSLTALSHFAICILIVVGGIIIKAISPTWLEFARNFF